MPRINLTRNESRTARPSKTQHCGKRTARTCGNYSRRSCAPNPIPAHLPLALRTETCHPLPRKPRVHSPKTQRSSSVSGHTQNFDVTIVDLGEANERSGEEGKNFILHRFLHQSTSPSASTKPRKANAVRSLQCEKAPESEGSKRAGATPLFRLTAAQKVLGVAPARFISIPDA
jgi:hypothetical protein